MMDEQLMQYQKFWDGSELPEGIYNVNLFSIEIIQSKKDQSISLIWKFYYNEQEIVRWDKLGSKRDYLIRKDIEGISNQRIENISDLPKFLPLIKNIPCTIEIKINGKFRNINIVKEKKSDINEFKTDELPDFNI